MKTTIGLMDNYPSDLTNAREKKLFDNLPDDTEFDYDFDLGMLLLKSNDDKYANWTFQGFIPVYVHVEVDQRKMPKMVCLK